MGMYLTDTVNCLGKDVSSILEDIGVVLMDPFMDGIVPSLQ